jgi:hypothetical protein
MKAEAIKLMNYSLKTVIDNYFPKKTFPRYCLILFYYHKALPHKMTGNPKLSGALPCDLGVTHLPPQRPGFRTERPV